MSAKINLLPDVRQAKLNEKNRKQLAISLTVGLVVISAGLLVFGFLIIQGQNVRVSQLTGSIATKKQQVANYPDVKPMLSMQAKVAALPQLYSQRTLMTKLLGALSSVEPQDVDFTTLSLTGQNQLSITSEGKSFLAAARLAKALEAANVTAGPDAKPTNEPYFSDVQLSAVTLASNKTGYTVTATVNQGATSGN